MKHSSFYKLLDFLRKIAPFLLVALIFVLIFFYADELIARPGGGHSHRGGGGGGSRSSGGGGGSGGSGGGELIFYFLRYAFPSFPAAFGIWLFPNWSDKIKNNAEKIGRSVGTVAGIGVSIAIYQFLDLGIAYYMAGIVLCVLAIGYRFAGEVQIDQLTSANPSSERQSNVNQIDNAIHSIVERDENFSKVLFLDYVRGLFHQFYFYGNEGKLSLLTPFIDNSLLLTREKEWAETGQKVSELVIGNAYISHVKIESDRIQRIWVKVESNYTLTNRRGAASRMVIEESWEMVRNADVCSLPPEKMQVVSCPNCGAAADFTTAGSCRNCNTTIKAGASQWYLNEIRVLNQSQFQTQGLGMYEEETGTNFPTIFHPNLGEQQRHFAAFHAISDINGYFQQFQKDLVLPVFLRIYEAWSNKKWQNARHLLTDFLYESQNFWMEMYQKQQLSNRLEKIQVSKIVPVKIETDKYYESITFRIYASCLDYTIHDKTQKIIGGNNSSPRHFTEYWTFIRRTGAEKTESPLNNCPNCGAPVDKMGMSGVCGYCNTKVSSGEFSWVLAYMTQDEVYRG